MLHGVPRKLWVLAEASESPETGSFVTFLPRRPAKWHRLVGIRLRECERKKTSSTLSVARG